MRSEQLRCHLLPVWVVLVLSGSAACATQADQSEPPSSTVASMQADIRQTGSALVEGMEFGQGQVSWTPPSTPALEQILAMLRSHSEWRFEVQVHTAELGDRDRDQALTDRRAEALVEWFTAHGVDASRLVPRGLGSSRPRHESAERPAVTRWSSCEN
jgi:outer membrane protein OmpA-like peptidoglycan-associated protein